MIVISPVNMGGHRPKKNKKITNHSFEPELSNRGSQEVSIIEVCHLCIYRWEKSIQKAEMGPESALQLKPMKLTTSLSSMYLYRVEMYIYKR